MDGVVVIIEQGGNQFGVTYNGGVIVDRFTVYDPDDRRRGESLIVAHGRRVSHSTSQARMDRPVDKQRASHPLPRLAEGRHGPHGAHAVEERHGETVYGESSDGRKLIEETHRGVTYVRPR